MKENRYIDGLLIISNDDSDEWIITCNGSDHVIFFEKNNKIRDCKLFVDNEEIEIPQTFMTKYVFIDLIIQIEGHPIHCVYEGGDFDLVIYGKYIKKKENYYPLKTTWFLALGLVLAIALLFIFVDKDKPVQEEIIAGAIGIVFLIAWYMDHLNKKEKKRRYILEEELYDQSKKIKRKIYIITFLSIALLVVSLIMQNKGMPMIIWLPMMIIFMVNGRYVAYLFKKQKEKENQE